MTSMMFGGIGIHPTPSDENVVRRTADPVVADMPAAVAQDAPDFNEVITDPNPLLGMETREVASKWNASQQYVPFWLDDATQEHDQLVNRTIASVGTAAAREAAGHYGRSISYAEGIEPTSDLRDGGKLTNEYFVAEDRPIQDGMGDYMTPTARSDDDAASRIAAYQATRQAQIESAYRDMWAAMNGN